MKDKETVSWQDRKASERFAMISPLLADDIDPAKKSQLRSRIAEANNISERTLYRLEAAWRRDGYSGLRPVNRQMRRSQKLPENFDEIIMQAVQLKKEVPSRSVARIILILEMEGWVLPGAIKRSTLQRYLYKEGFGVKQMKRYKEARNATSRRFCKPHRMMLA
jgi:transposase